MQLFDAHCHIQDERYGERSAGELLAVAGAAGVRRVMCCGTCESDWGRVAELGARSPAVLVSFGLHPWYAAERSAGWLEVLRHRLEQLPGAGVGEIGLDHALRDADLDAQESLFMEQYRLSIDLRRPASLHCRRAFGRMLELLSGCGPHPAGFVVHSYSGSVELIEPFVHLGGYVSFSGTITYPKRRRVVAALLAAPRDRLLIETDAPDMTPFTPQTPDVHFDPRGLGLNEPARLPAVLERAALLRQCPVPELAEQLWHNAGVLFSSCMNSLPVAGETA